MFLNYVIKMKLKKVISLVFCSLSFNFGVANASFAVPGISNISNGSTTSTFNRTEGWEFTVNQDINITKLGLWDRDNNGFFGSHEVGLWNSSRDLLTSVVISSISNAEGNPTNEPSGIFRYEAVAEAITLTSGNSYIVGAVYSGSGISDSVIRQSIATTSPEITLGDAVQSSSSSSLNFPASSISSFNDGVFGANFQYEVAATSVPFEFRPGIGIALTLAAIGLSARKRKHF